jgi:hypothetical protein
LQASECARTIIIPGVPAIEEIFDGTLCDWDYKPVSLQLKDGAKPYHGRPFPISKKHLEITKKEIQ